MQSTEAWLDPPAPEWPRYTEEQWRQWRLQRSAQRVIEPAQQQAALDVPVVPQAAAAVAPEAEASKAEKISSSIEEKNSDSD
jgi:hypothetical protein